MKRVTEKEKVNTAYYTTAGEYAEPLPHLKVKASRSNLKMFCGVRALSERFLAAKVRKRESLQQHAVGEP